VLGVISFSYLLYPDNPDEHKGYGYCKTLKSAQGEFPAVIGISKR
jgi:hypothetical protein